MPEIAVTTGVDPRPAERPEGEGERDDEARRPRAIAVSSRCWSSAPGDRRGGRPIQAQSITARSSPWRRRRPCADCRVAQPVRDHVRGHEPQRPRPSGRPRRPAWTSASSSIESASLRVVRRFEQRRHRARHRLGQAALEGISCSSIQPIGRRPRHRPAAGSGRGRARARRRASAASSPGAAVTGARRTRSPTRVSARRFRPRSAPTNRATKSDAGLRQDLGRRAELGEVTADLHHRDEVAHLDRLVDVVGDEQDRLGELLLEAEELVLEPLPDDRVDRPEGLVHEQHRRVGGERAGHADALALAARELARIAIAVAWPVRGPTSAEQLLARARAGVPPSSRAVAAPSPTFSPIVWWGNSPTCWMT